MNPFHTTVKNGANEQRPMWVTGAKLMSRWFMIGARFTFTKEESVTAWKSLA